VSDSRGFLARDLRKTVTVVFSDVMGSTAIGELLDPETLRRLMQRWYDEMKAVCEAHGGRVRELIGDAVMAVFGVPIVHEDDALRAVRAAADMRAGLETLNDELERDFGLRLRSRTGVNTGEVIVRDPDPTGALALGDAVNVVARLQGRRFSSAIGTSAVPRPSPRAGRAGLRVEPDEVGQLVQRFHTSAHLSARPDSVADFGKPRANRVMRPYDAAAWFERQRVRPVTGRDGDRQEALAELRVEMGEVTPFAPYDRMGANTAVRALTINDQHRREPGERARVGERERDRSAQRAVREASCGGAPGLGREHVRRREETVEIERRLAEARDSEPHERGCPGRVLAKSGVEAVRALRAEIVPTPHAVIDLAQSGLAVERDVHLVGPADRRRRHSRGNLGPQLVLQAGTQIGIPALRSPVDDAELGQTCRCVFRVVHRQPGVLGELRNRADAWIQQCRSQDRVFGIDKDRLRKIIPHRVGRFADRALQSLRATLDRILSAAVLRSASRFEPHATVISSVVFRSAINHAPGSGPPTAVPGRQLLPPGSKQRHPKLVGWGAG
jgi:hypothetical protein